MTFIEMIKKLDSGKPGEFQATTPSCKMPLLKLSGGVIEQMQPIGHSSEPYLRVEDYLAEDWRVK